MLDSIPVILFVSTILGFLSGIGIGGGSLLIIWLTVVLGMPQETARTINLLFFIPSAIVACLFRWKQGALKLRKILPAIAAGCIAAILFSLIGFSLNTKLLQKAFGLLLMATGVREVTYKSKKP